jgi:hypothetical protein
MIDKYITELKAREYFGIGFRQKNLSINVDYQLLLNGKDSYFFASRGGI